MRLIVTTPAAVLLDVEGVEGLRATDPTGQLGIRPGHEDFLTLLEPGVLVWSEAGRAHYVAVSEGILTVGERGRVVRVVAREAALGDDLEQLRRGAVREFRDRLRTEAQGSRGVAHLQASLLRRLNALLRPGAGALGPGRVPRPEEP